jgi:hypothetical protein
MILFYCGHKGLISQIISVKCHRHPHEDSILVMPGNNYPEINFAKRLVEEKIFSKIVGMNSTFSYKEESVEKQEQKIIGYIHKWVQQNNIDFNNFSDIYVITDIYGEFEVYLSIKNIPHIVIEPFMKNFNSLDDEQKYSKIKKIVTSAHPSYAEVLEKYKALYGSGDICKKRLRSESGASDHSKSLPKDEWVDFESLFNTIPDEYKNLICKCLDENSGALQEKGSCLVLPNSGGICSNFTRLDIAHVNVVYQLALDYYHHNDESRIFVKDHPFRDVNFSLDKYIENPVVLDVEIPIEFYKFIPNFSINKVLSIATTALDKIADCVKENIRLGSSYYTYFRLCHRLFFAFSLHLKLNSEKTVCNYAKGVDEEFIHNFARFCFEDLPNYELKMGFGWQSLKGDNFIILDEVPPENKKGLIAGLDGADPLTKIVFLNSKKDFAFFDFERFDLLEYITPFVVKKTALNDKCLSDTEDETLFFFCKDKNVREKAKSFVLQKSLKHTKLSLEISAIDIEDIYPSLYRREYASRIQEINRAFESQNKRISDVAEQVVKLESSQKISYEELSKSLDENRAHFDTRIDALTDICQNLAQTVERLSADAHKNETQTNEVLERLHQSFDSRLNDVIQRSENVENRLTQTVEQLSVEMRKNEMRTEERIT